VQGGKCPDETNIVVNENDNLCKDYIGHGLILNVCLYLRVVYTALADFRGKNEVESSLFIHVGGIVYGGLFIGHMVDTYGLTIN
jgi:hypothetical protein